MNHLLKVRTLHLYIITICMFFLAITTNLTAETIPKRIVSLGPGITEALCLLGAADTIIANTIYCKEIPDKPKLTKIGTIVMMDMEKIVSLNPDLVIGIGLSNKKQIQTLENLNIPVETFNYPKSYKQLCTSLIRLGKLVGKEKKASEVVNKSNQQVQLIKEKIKEYPPKTVFVQIGAKPLFSAITDSFIGDIIAFAGGDNIVKNQNTGLYSREKVLHQNPDIIIITTMGIVGEKEKSIWQTFSNLNAIKNNRIYIIDSYELCSPTVETFPDILEKVTEIIHPNFNSQPKE